MPTEPLGEGVPEEPLAADEDDLVFFFFNVSTCSLPCAL